MEIIKDVLTGSVRKRILSASSLDESLDILQVMLSSGIAVWTDGSLYNIKQLVGSVRGLKIEMYPREHSPPHFHVVGGGIDALFSLEDGSFLAGNIPGREQALVKFWYNESRPLLVETWNKLRPSNCPVGPIT